ncbi:hypothetical protein [Devosia chinhatensis]|uniref:Ig-like domain-containing protein n=1 Tax=Devosia chinhatensis TaxID=429727 RepID=A0A0F5FMF7_9HYPH|nr:hypothetical protein [Devosia chinhatensis]KKB09397.1 hypothetical protein VE26_05520 [Devosia chinhatensis]
MKTKIMLGALITLIAPSAMAQQYTYEQWPIQQSEWLYFDPPVNVENIWRAEFDEADMTFKTGLKMTDAQDTYFITCREWDEAGNRLSGTILYWSDETLEETKFAAAWYLVNERGSPYSMLQWAEACARHDMTD